MRTELEEAAAAWAARPGGDRRLATLRALCDTYVPAVDPPPSAPPDAFWVRRASDLRTERAVAGYLQTRLPDADRADLEQLLDVLGASGFAHLPLGARTSALLGLRRTSREVARGLDGLRALTSMLFYALPDTSGRNPNWSTLDYPGPPTPPAPGRRRVRPFTTRPGTRRVTLQADVCVVGSGSGGGVIAGVLAAAGKDVVVLEAGGNFEPPDFPGDELSAYRDLYWRGGFTPTADDTVTLVAGATLGGGSTVNWTNCVAPPPWVREQWTRHGLAGLDGGDFDEHLSAVSTRLSVTDVCSEPNGPNQRLSAGAAANGWSSTRARRNTDPTTYDPATAGHMGFGDISGSKQDTPATYLADADQAGARIVVRCRAQRVVVEDGRAAGVEATLADGQPLRVHAPTVVAACGALETPALLLRSGIGGPAVGQHLRLHPVVALPGFYPEAQRTWWGAPQTVIVDEFADLADGYGFLVETPHSTVGLTAAALPWRSGHDHKRLMGRIGHAATFIGLLRDRGGGRVTVDDSGEAVVRYPLTDRMDLANLRTALDTLARLHAGAGAQAVVDLAHRRTLWRRGANLEQSIAKMQRDGFGAGGRPLFSAHQMGTARMGPDPATSVADPDGQLHDTPGVWIGDTSAFPTASGANPMLTCMALARRTAHALLAADPAG